MLVPSIDTAVAHIRRDAEAGRLEGWGQSTLIDEFTGVPSIERELFDTLHAAAGLTATFPVGNAGVLHVYGYWFSEVPTPFGYKRDRWADGALAQALGLDPAAFHLTEGTTPTAETSGTTLLERVTAAVIPLLLTPPADAHTADIVVDDQLTRVVAIPALPGRSSVLIYGSAPLAAPAAMRLITTFPVASDPAALVTECVATPRRRFNAA